MKILQKATLAAAIAAAPFAAQAELKAMDEAAMSATTGQAGVTIEIGLDTGVGANSAVKVGSVSYKDEGGIKISTIEVGTNNANGIALTQTIDVGTSGQLQMKTTNEVNGLVIAIDKVELTKPGASSTDPQVVVGDALASDIDLEVDLGTTTTSIGANSTYTAADRIGYTAASGGNPEKYDTNQGVSENTIVIDSSASFELKSSSMKALGGAVGLNDITFNDNGNKASIKQKIWATNSIPASGGNPAYQGGLNMKISSISGDLTIGKVELGGASIGSVTVSDITMSGMTQKIYGH